MSETTNITDGMADGKHVMGTPLTTENAALASPSLLANAIDQAIVKVRPMATPLDQISRMGHTRPVDSMEVDYYSVDTRADRDVITDFGKARDVETAARTVRSIAGSVALEPETLVVMESTADGEDNYFHDEWERAVKGRSDKVPVFVPWHEIEICRRAFADEGERRRLVEEMDDYERALLAVDGVTLENVHWYHCKRREYATHEQMMAEYPSTPDEAFTASATPPRTNCKKVG